MKDVQNQNLAGFGRLGWGLLAIVTAPAIALLASIPNSGDPNMYWSMPLGIALVYAPFFWLLKWAYSWHLKIWSSAADSLGLLLSRKFWWPGWFYYSLEGEYKGYSIRVYQVSAIKGGSWMHILKCPESLRQRVKDGEIGGVVGTLQGKSRPWYAAPLPAGYEVFVKDGDFRFSQIGGFLDIASAVEQMADLVARLEDSPKDAINWKYRGDAYRKKGDYAQAISDYGEAIRLKPDSHYAWAGRGRAHRSLGNEAEAAADFKKAKELREEAS